MQLARFFIEESQLLNNITLGIASENSLAKTISNEKFISLGFSLETSIAKAKLFSKNYSLNTSVENTSAKNLTYVNNATINKSLEVSAGAALNTTKSFLITKTLELSSGKTLENTKLYSLQTASSSENSLPVFSTPTFVITKPAEISNTKSLNSRKDYFLGKAVTTESAEILVSIPGESILKAVSSEKTFSQKILKQTSLIKAVSVGTTSNILTSKIITLQQVKEISVQRSLLSDKSVDLTKLISLEKALPLMKTSTTPMLVNIGKVSEGSSVNIYIIKDLAINSGGEINTSKSLTLTKSYKVTKAASTETSVPFFQAPKLNLTWNIITKTNFLVSRVIKVLNPTSPATHKLGRNIMLDVIKGTENIITLELEADALMIDHSKITEAYLIDTAGTKLAESSGNSNWDFSNPNYIQVKLGLFDFCGNKFEGFLVVKTSAYPLGISWSNPKIEISLTGY